MYKEYIMGKYIKQLSNEDIIRFLSDNNYELDENIKKNNGKKLSSIERNEDMIFMRCRRIFTRDEQEINALLAYKLMHKYPGFMSLSTFATINKYSTDTDIVILTDFQANIISAYKDREKRVDSLDENYAHFMAKKFKDQGYISDYIKDVENFEATLNSPNDEMSK